MIYRNKTSKNDYAKDNRLSLQARGLLSYVFECQDDTKFTCLNLQTYTKSKRTVIETTIKELVNLGYAERTKIRICGKYSSNIDFYETPKIPYNKNDRLGYLYVVKMGDFYKIGTSKRPNERLKEFTKLPFELESVICECIFGYQDIEMELHQKFYGKRVRGEWFLLNENDLEFIKTYIKDIMQKKED